MVRPGSAVYTGWVAHRRLGRVAHHFKYGLYMTALNLRDADRFSGPGRSWAQRLGLVRFSRADHLRSDGDTRSLLSTARMRVEAELAGPARVDDVVLLTHLAQFGYRFNPVSFYFCLENCANQEPQATGRLPDEGGNEPRLTAIVLEVNNTPWGEQHCYVLDCRDQQSPFEFCLDKNFHVSPFLPMAMEYRFRFVIKDNGQQISIVKENWAAGERVFQAVLKLHREPIAALETGRVLLRFPLMTLRVTAAIYWEALRLLVKGARFLGHTGAPLSSPDTSSSTTERVGDRPIGGNHE